MQKVILVIVFVCIYSFQSTGQKVEEIWVSEKLFKVPESVLYYSADDVLFVANINGSSNPRDKDNNGFISKVTTEGIIISLKWATGLNAPKGMVIYKKHLFVADIDELVEIDLETGRIIKKHKAERALFLNDVTADQSGNIYVSDYHKEHSMIYILKDGKLSIWAKGNEFNKPNGLFAGKDVLFYGNSGDGKIKSIDYKNMKIRIFAETGGGIDGLKSDGKGNFIISNWEGKVSLVKKEGTVITLFDTTDDKINAADIEFIPGKNILFVPTFFDNRIFAYKIY